MTIEFATVHFRCPCGQLMEAQKEFVGKRTRCPACGELVLISDDAPGAGGEERIISAPSRPERDSAAPAAPPGEGAAAPAGKGRRRRKQNPWALLAGIAAVVLIAGGLAVW